MRTCARPWRCPLTWSGGSRWSGCVCDVRCGRRHERAGDVSAAVGTVVRCMAGRTHCTPQRGRVSNGAFSRRMMHAQPPHGGTREPHSAPSGRTRCGAHACAGRRDGGLTCVVGWVRRWGARYVWGESDSFTHPPNVFSTQTSCQIRIFAAKIHFSSERTPGRHPLRQSPEYRPATPMPIEA